MFLHVSVILSTEGVLPQCMLGYHPLPPGAGTTPEQTPTPREQTPQEQTPQEQAHPPRASPPPGAVHAGRYGQQPDGTHTIEIHSCLIF